METKVKLGAVHMPTDYIINSDRRIENKDGIAFIPAGANIIFICARDAGAYNRTLHRARIALGVYDSHNRQA